jgi:hypothetical protein
MEIYTAEGKRLANTVITFRQKLRLGSSCISREFNNSVRSAEILLDTKVRVCGSMRAKRSIPPDVEQAAKHGKEEQSAFRMKRQKSGVSGKDDQLCKQL